MGNLQKEFKELKKAKASYLKAIEIRPTFASAQNNLGLVLDEIGDSKTAIECYKKALEISHQGLKPTKLINIKSSTDL